MRHVRSAARSVLPLLLVASCAPKASAPAASSNTSSAVAAHASANSGVGKPAAARPAAKPATVPRAPSGPRRVDGALVLVEPRRLGAAALALSRDGKYAAFGLADHTVQIWDLTKRKRVASFRYGRTISALAISPDGLYVAVGGEVGASDVSLWKRGDKTVTRMRTHSGRVNALDFSLDGKMLASASDDEEAAMWDVAKRRRFRVLQFSAACGGDCRDEQRVVAVRFVNKRLLAFAQNTEVKLVHARTGNKVGESYCAGGENNSACGGVVSSNIAVGPRGRWMAFHTSKGCAQLISYTGWCRRLKPKKEGAPPSGASVAFLPSGELLVPMGKRRYATWTVKGRRRKDRTFGGGTELAVSAATSQVVSIGSNTHALLEPLVAGKGKPARLVYWSTTRPSVGAVVGLFFSKDGKYLEGRDAKRRPLRWSVGSFALARPAKPSQREPVARDGIRIAAGQNYSKTTGLSKKRFERFERISSAMEKSFQCCGGDCVFPYRSIAFSVLVSPDGKVAAYRDDNNELTFVGLSKAARARLPKKARAVLAFSGNRWLALIDATGALAMVDLKKKTTYDLAKHAGEIGQLELRQLPGGKVLVATADAHGVVRVQRLGAERVFKTRPPGGVSLLLLGPHGRFVVVAGDDDSLRAYPLPAL